MGVKTYSPDLVVVSVGSVPIGGFAATDDCIKIEPQGERMTTEVGADGEVLRTKNMVAIIRITLTLIGSSASNDVLSALATLDEVTPGGSGVVSAAITDLSGRSILVSPESWVVAIPAKSFGKKTSDVAWLIDCVKGKLIVGGNN